MVISTSDLVEIIIIGGKTCRGPVLLRPVRGHLVYAVILLGFM